MPMGDRRRAIVLGAVFGTVITVASAALAVALTLVTTSALAAGQVAINAPCDTAYQIDLTAPVWDAGTGQYVVTGFVMSGLDWQPCTSSLIQVNALDANGVSLADALIAVVDGTYNWSQPVPAASVASIASVIYQA